MNASFNSESSEDFKQPRPHGSRPIWDKTKKFYHWVFTIQQWDEVKEASLLASDVFNYIILGKEIAPDTGREHIQGFASFKSQRYWSGVKALLYGAWCEPAENVEASIAYCKKDGKYTTSGTEPTPLIKKIEGMYSLLEHYFETEEIDEEAWQNALDDILFIIDETHENLVGSKYCDTYNGAIIYTEDDVYDADMDEDYI